MTRHPFQRLAGAFLTLAAAGIACAQEAGPVRFSGYGTFGVVRSDNDRADYLADAFKPNGPGYSREWSADVDSRIGAQLSVALSPRLTAVVQVLAQQRYDNSYRPGVEWANLKYDVTPELSVRVGRVVLPAFMVTDSRRVGYANPWVRPPVEMYSLVPVATNDGMDASLRLPMLSLTNTLQVTAGGSTSKFPDASGFDAGEARARRLLTVADTLEHGPTQLRLVYGRADLTIAALAPLFDIYRQLGPAGLQIVDRYDLDGKMVDFVGVGLSHDPGEYFVMGEWARFDTRSIVGRKTSWYLSGGVRLGKVTPYVTYARVRSNGPTSDPGVPTTFLPPEIQPLVGLANAVLNERLALVPQQDTLSIGLRWDALKNLALKVQVDDVRLRHGSPGTFGHVQPGFIESGKARLFSVAADFVF
jgi:hypothetical protein